MEKDMYEREVRMFDCETNKLVYEGTAVFKEIFKFDLEGNKPVRGEENVRHYGGYCWGLLRGECEFSSLEFCSEYKVATNEPKFTYKASETKDAFGYMPDIYLAPKSDKDPTVVMYSLAEAKAKASEEKFKYFRIVDKEDGKFLAKLGLVTSTNRDIVSYQYIKPQRLESFTTNQCYNPFVQFFEYFTAKPGLWDSYPRYRRGPKAYLIEDFFKEGKFYAPDGTYKKGVFQNGVFEGDRYVISENTTESKTIHDSYREWPIIRYTAEVGKRSTGYAKEKSYAIREGDEYEVKFIIQPDINKPLKYKGDFQKPQISSSNINPHVL